MPDRPSIYSYNTLVSFSTESGINYMCSFSDVTNLYAPILSMYDIHLVDFSIAADRDSPPADYKTGKIVCDLIKDGFKSNKDILTYVCDETDGRQRQRQFRFQQWCDRHLPDYTLQPINITLETDQGLFNRYAGLLTHPEFPHDEELQHYLIRNVAGIVAEKSNPVE